MIKTMAVFLLHTTINSMNFLIIKTNINSNSDKKIRLAAPLTNKFSGFLNNKKINKQ